MTPERVKSILETAKPLPDHLVQKIDSLSDVEKMRIGVAALMTLAKAKFEAGDATYDEVVRDVLARVDRNEYKRRQAPLVLRTSPKAFGSGRRLPIVHRYTGGD